MVTADKKAAIEQIYIVIANVLDLDRNALIPDADFRADLGADSLDLAQLIVSLGNQFDAQIRDNDVRMITTVGDTIEYLLKTIRHQ